ncbi:flavin reductase family protein [Pusillimonas sp. DMV24BSW_D]|uniref:flavin reductase family protein n=1 Tax=Neopusillimonas aestuarii TaxID=2716226 RepID=UPI00140AE92B|nr:flavin reductase family protein [Pusillimonas sp. DMV24BSW_D]QIM47726.1 flavin reductase family protein [Pusillimonas sp. DMV24BSW_D]
MEPSVFETVLLKHANRLINHGPTVLVTSAHNGKQNVMAAAWSMPVEFDPPRIAIVIDKTTYTRELIESSGVFGICIPGVAAVDLTYSVGRISGREHDKISALQMPIVAGETTGVPLLEQSCSAWMECRHLPEKHTEDAYDTCFAEVVNAAANSTVFTNGRWQFNDANKPLHTIHHLGGGVFSSSGTIVQGKNLL